MSALTPKNGKYRNSWKIFGKQLSNKEMCNNYNRGYDNIKWGDPDKFIEEKQTLDGHLVIKIK